MTYQTLLKDKELFEKRGDKKNLDKVNANLKRYSAQEEKKAEVKEEVTKSKDKK